MPMVCRGLYLLSGLLFGLGTAVSPYLDGTITQVFGMVVAGGFGVMALLPRRQLVRRPKADSRRNRAEPRNRLSAAAKWNVGCGSLIFALVVTEVLRGQAQMALLPASYVTQVLATTLLLVIQDRPVAPPPGRRARFSCGHR